MPTDLTKYSDGGWFSEGEHLALVFGVKTGNSQNTGTPFVEFSLRDEVGQTMPLRLFLTDKAMYRLAQFARACGLNEQELRQYEHRMLVNRKVVVFVHKNEDGFHEIASWMKPGSVVERPEPEPEPEQSDYNPYEEVDKGDLPF